MARGKKLVIGASGFLGSHVTRRLVENGEDVRVMLRRTSSTKGIDDLDVERCYGDIFDDNALREAMTGCDVVFYCVVDARIWLRDPTPLFRTNVEGLRHVLDAALDAGLERFVFTSTTGTIAASDEMPATEDDPHNWTESSGYVQSRLAAENLVMEYARSLIALVAEGKFLLPRLLRRGGGHRRRCARNGSRLGPRLCRGALHHFGSVHGHP